MNQNPQELRLSTRKFFKTQALMIYEGQQLSVSTADISLGGMAIIGDYNLSEGKSIVIAFNIPSVKQTGNVYPVKMQGVIAYCAFSASVKSFKAGIKFVELDEQSKMVLEQYLK